MNLSATVGSPAPEADPALAYARQLTLVVYVLHAVTSVTVVTFFVAIFINYSRRDRVAGTIYESHFDWQIRTFWFTLAWFVLGLILLGRGIFVLAVHGGVGYGSLALGVLVLFVNWCWHLYRAIRGLMHWSERQPM
jgi:uncharacterized membrane protein